ncbi:MAG: response regulator transcription factor [Dehalococcoidales bacterium]
MLSVIIIAKESDQIKKLASRLNRDGLTCSVTADGEKALTQVAREPPDLLLVDIDTSSAVRPPWDLSQRTDLARTTPIIALIPRGRLSELAADAGIDDFLVKPYSIDELAARVQRLLKGARNADTGEVIKCGDLLIDLARYEARLSNRLVELTYREYKLLGFLAANRGRVFTREALLNRVWGYDYLGGDRTVDVHIRRLRSKIEDADHTFIDTVRNIGYRFRRGK